MTAPETTEPAAAPCMRPLSDSVRRAVLTAELERARRERDRLDQYIDLLGRRLCVDEREAFL